MRFLSPTTHGIGDYLLGLVLVTAPGLFIAAEAPTGRYVLQVFGAALLLQALLTRFPLGVARVLPMRWHLRMDLVLGLLLASSPWWSDFIVGNAWITPLVLGIGLVVWSAITWGDPPVGSVVGVPRRDDRDLPRAA